MSWRNWYAQVRWTLGREWFGVWEVKNYYTRLEERARIGAQITFGYFLLVLAAATISTGGLLTNNTAVVIGSMCVAPFLGPSRAVCIGALFRDRRIFLGGLFKQLIGLLLVGTTCAYLITAILAARGFDLPLNAEIVARSMPTMRDVILSILIATTAGVAASLALVADPQIAETPWGQVIDAMIGVEIAISLIPPAAVVGIALALARPDIALRAFWLLMINVLGLDILGSTLTLGLRGVRIRYLRMEQAIRRAVTGVLAGAMGVTLTDSVVDVTLLNPSVATVRVTAYMPGDASPASDLAQRMAESIEKTAGFRAAVPADLVPRQAYSTL